VLPDRCPYDSWHSSEFREEHHPFKITNHGER
jgi:hypothetical protein